MKTASDQCARLALASGLLALAALSVGAARAPQAEIRAVPSARTVAVGGTITVEIRIANGRRVGSVPFTLTYDPALLEPIESRAREGSFLSSGGAATTFLARAGRAPGGASGVIVGLSRLDDAPARGRGLLCTLTFRARAPGVAHFGFARAELLSPAARPLPARFTGSSVHVGAGR